MCVCMHVSVCMCKIMFDPSCPYIFFFFTAHAESQAAAPPLNIHKAICEVATDYTKKKNVLRLRLHDGAEFLLEASGAEEMNEWLNKIVYYAGTLKLCTYSFTLRLSQECK